MKALIKFLMFSTFSFMLMLLLVYGLVYKFRDRELPFQEEIRQAFKKAEIDSSLISEVPTAEQLRARDYEERRLALDEKETSLKKDEHEINFKRDSLMAVRQELDMLIGQREGFENERLKKLAKVYENMRAEDAAPIISQLDDQTIVEIFLQMDDRMVSRILGQMPVDRATEITQRLSGTLY